MKNSRYPTARFAIAVLCLAVTFPGRVDGETDAAFAIPKPGRQMSFPADHGSHPEFRIEWWYLTGHLFAEEADKTSRRFGYQATFFRLADAPGKPSEVAFGKDPLFMAHMAISDSKTGRFVHEERLNRAGWDGFAMVGDLNLRNGNWTLKRNADDSLQLRGSVRAEARFDLSLEPEKGPVIFGENSVSRKSEDPSAASYYITFTRLKTEGTLRLGGREFAVTGETWMDHEISSSQLDRNQVGWDWASLQFFDGRELMAYVLRTTDGGIDPFSTLAWIDRGGRVSHQSSESFTWEFGGEWISPETKAAYPIQPTIRTVDPDSGAAVSFTLRPTLEAQEISGEIGGVSYWEGACDVLDSQGDIVGRAFLELTGYTAGESLRNRLQTTR